jgi:4'-phosphopantetheinyl transferase
LDLLDQAERERLARLRTAILRRRFAVSHVAMREILGSYLHIHPRDVLIGRRPCAACGGPHGKPEILGNRTRLKFNLSHSDRIALLAIATRELGVDLEACGRQVEFERLAEHILTQAELKSFERLRGDRQQAAFFACWTRKEAAAKAAGAGLTLDFREIRLEDGGRRACLPDGDRLERCFALVDLHLDVPGYVAALAIDSPTGRVRHRRWPTDLRPEAGAV